MYEDLERFLSKERLKPYLEKTNNDKEKAIELYDWNIKLSKDFYPLLSYFEVILRNVCNDKLKKEIGDKWYLNNDLLSGNNSIKGEKAINEIQKAILKIKKRKEIKKVKNFVITNGDIISNLEFGFWSNLFNANYEFKIWLPYLRYLFPIKNRKELYKKIDSMRELRNRIFHYEPIIFDKKLKEKYEETINLIIYLTKNNINVYQHIKTFDNFKKSYSEYKKTRGFIK